MALSPDVAVGSIEVEVDGGDIGVEGEVVVELQDADVVHSGGWVVL